MREESLLGHASLRDAWDRAARIVQVRPWLTISWIAHPDPGNRWHLVVHDGAEGASLQFDDEAGPTFAGGADIRSLDWDELSDDADWMEEWGPADPSAALTPKTAAYRLLGELAGIGREWTVQPARFLGSDDDPLSIYSLQEEFPTIGTTVDSYLDLLGVQFRDGELAGRPEYWHEPIWLILREGRAIVLVDEAGRVHSSAVATPRDVEISRTPRDLGEFARRIVRDADDVVASRRGPRTQESRHALRVYIDVASILNESNQEEPPNTRSADDDRASSNPPSRIDHEFADAFGDDWSSSGLPGPRDGVEWTLYLGSDGGDWSDLLRTIAAEDLVGYVFAGGRLLVDRFFDGTGCDVLITRGDTRRIRRLFTEIIRLGAPGTEDWRATAAAIARRAGTGPSPMP